MSAPVAVVLPLHRPKFSYALHLAASWQRCNQSRHFDVYPVFSSDADSARFEALLAEHGLPRGAWRPLVIAPDRRNPVTSKRFRALHHVFTHHAYRLALGVDAEAEFASSSSFMHELDQWASRREVLAARLWNTARCPKRVRIANESCAAAAAVPSGSPAQTAGLYLWWLDVPIFERRDYLDFYDALRWPALSSYWFDHFAYLCWKLKARDSKQAPKRDVAPLARAHPYPHPHPGARLDGTGCGAHRCVPTRHRREPLAGGAGDLPPPPLPYAVCACISPTREPLAGGAGADHEERLREFRLVCFERGGLPQQSWIEIAAIPS